MVKSVNTNKVEMDKKAAIAVVFENSEFGKIRTLTDENGEPLFCAKDLCNVLGYKRANDAVDQLVKPLDTAKRRTWVATGLKRMEAEVLKVKDPALKAVRYAVLGKVYRDSPYGIEVDESGHVSGRNGCCVDPHRTGS